MNEYAGSWHGTKNDLIEALERIHELWPEKMVMISEFGLEAGWTEEWWMGPSSQYESEDYYYIAPGTPPHSEEVYAQRRQVILEQMQIFRCHPFVAGAIFWTYQDYRSFMDFHMGIVDENRQRTPIWDVLREQYSPVLIESGDFIVESNYQQRFSIDLRTRGPVEEDMPAYTLRGYQLRWEIISQEGGKLLEEGNLTLPDLPPASAWSNEILWNIPKEDYVVRISILRPLGFAVLERTYNARGEVLR